MPATPSVMLPVSPHCLLCRTSAYHITTTSLLLAAVFNMMLYYLKHVYTVYVTQKKFFSILVCVCVCFFFLEVNFGHCQKTSSYPHSHASCSSTIRLCQSNYMNVCVLTLHYVVDDYKLLFSTTTKHYCSGDLFLRRIT